MDTATPRSTSRDRRHGNRHRLELPATATPAGADAAPFAVTVTHFSVNGVGLRTAVPLPVGGVYAVACFDSLIPPNLTVKVVTRRDLAAGKYDVGAEVV